jgi:hypothetical protein
MAIDPIVLLIVGSAAAIAIVVLAAYKTAQGQTRSSSIGAVQVSVPISESPKINTQGADESPTPPSETAFQPSPVYTSPVVASDTTNDYTEPSQQDPPAGIINLATPFPVEEATAPVPTETPIQTPVEPIVAPIDTTFEHTPSVDSTPINSAPEITEEAPSPFPEETSSINTAPQTPAPTDVSAVANIATANTTVSPVVPVLVINPPKRRTSRPRKAPGAASGIPRKKRNSRGKTPTDKNSNFTSASESP